MSGVHRFLDQCVLPLGFTQKRLYDQPIPHSLNADWNHSASNAHERACNVTEAGRMRLGCQVHAALKRFIDHSRQQKQLQTGQPTMHWFEAVWTQANAKRRLPTAACNALRGLESHGLCPLAAEVEVYWWPAQLGTRIDVLCMDKRTNALVPVELKTRRSPQAALHTRCQGRPLRYPFSVHDANLANLHFVQTMVGQILLEKTMERLFLAAPSSCDSHLMSMSCSHAPPVTALRQILACIPAREGADCTRMPIISPAAVLYVGSADTQAVLQFVPRPMLEQKLQLQLLMSRAHHSSLSFTSMLSTPPLQLSTPTLSKLPRAFGSSASGFGKRTKAKRKRVKIRHNDSAKKNDSMK